MTTSDARWDDGDRDDALLWLAEDRLRCECGEPLDESTDPSKAANVYVAETMVCHACAARSRKVNALTEDGRKPLDPGLKLLVRDRSKS